MRDPRIEEIRRRVQELSQLLGTVLDDGPDAPTWFRKVWTRTGRRGKWHRIRGMQSYGRGYVCGCGVSTSKRYGDVEVEYTSEEPENLCRWAEVRPEGAHDDLR